MITVTSSQAVSKYSSDYHAPISHRTSKKRRRTTITMQDERLDEKMTHHETLSSSTETRPLVCCTTTVIHHHQHQHIPVAHQPLQRPNSLSEWFYGISTVQHLPSLLLGPQILPWWNKRRIPRKKLPSLSSSLVSLPIVLLRRPSRFLLLFIFVFVVLDPSCMVHSDQSSSNNNDDVAADAYYNPNAAYSTTSSGGNGYNNNDDTAAIMTSTQILNPVVTSNYECTSSSSSSRYNQKKPQVLVSLLSVVCDTPGAYYSGSNAYRNSHVCIGGDKAKMDILFRIPTGLQQPSTYYSNTNSSEGSSSSYSSKSSSYTTKKLYVEVEMGLYDHFTLVQQRTSLCVLNVLQLSSMMDPNIDTDISFIDPSECPHAGIYQWTSYYTVPDDMISDPSLHYVPDFRITFSTDTGNRIGCTITGPIALRMIAAQKERDGLIAFGIALCIFVSIFGILLLCSQYRRMLKRTNGTSSSTSTSGMMLQQRFKPRHSGIISPSQKQQQPPPPPYHHPYPYYNNHNNSSSNRSRSSTISSSNQYVRTMPNGQVVVTNSNPSIPPLPLPPSRRMQQSFRHHGSDRMVLSTSVEEGEEDDDDDDDECDEDYMDEDDVSSSNNNHHRPTKQCYYHQPGNSQQGRTAHQPPHVVRSNPKYNETQLPSRPII